MVAGPLKRMVSNIEVERKFNPGSKFASLLAECTWKEPQARRHKFCDRREGASFSVSSLPGQLIRNTYYDTADERLSKLGLWVRQRYVHVLQLNPARLANKEYSEVHGERPLTLANGGKGEAEWNAKLRLGGHYSNSQFVEFDGRRTSRTRYCVLPGRGRGSRTCEQSRICRHAGPCGK